MSRRSSGGGQEVASKRRKRERDDEATAEEVRNELWKTEMELLGSILQQQQRTPGEGGATTTGKMSAKVGSRGKVLRHHLWFRSSCWIYHLLLRKVGVGSGGTHEVNVNPSVSGRKKNPLDKLYKLPPMKSMMMMTTAAGNKTSSSRLKKSRHTVRQLLQRRLVACGKLVQEEMNASRLNTLPVCMAILAAFSRLHLLLSADEVDQHEFALNASCGAVGAAANREKERRALQLPKSATRGNQTLADMVKATLTSSTDDRDD